MTHGSALASLPADRRGRLRNHATPGDFLAAPRCGARTRADGCCRQPAMANGRCRMHGGLSTGPRTAAGRACCAAARRTTASTRPRPWRSAAPPLPTAAGSGRSSSPSAAAPPLGTGSFLRIRRVALLAAAGPRRKAPRPQPARQPPRLRVSAWNPRAQTARPPLGMGCFLRFPNRRSTAVPRGTPSPAPPSVSAPGFAGWSLPDMSSWRHFSAPGVDAPVAAGHKAAPCRSVPISNRS